MKQKQPLNTENCIKIKMQKECILLYDDRILISWIHDDENIMDLETYPRRYKRCTLIIFIVSVIALTLSFIFRRSENSIPFLYLFIQFTIPCTLLVESLYRIGFSTATEIQRNQIQKISVLNNGKLSIFFGSNKRKKIREIALPGNKEKKEQALRLLEENRLLVN